MAQTVTPPKFKNRWQRIAWEYNNISPRAQSSFYYRLCEMICVADMQNTARLRKAFPELVNIIKGALNMVDCPNCGTEDSMRPLLSHDPGTKDVLKCRTCGFETNKAVMKRSPVAIDPVRQILEDL